MMTRMMMIIVVVVVVYYYLLHYDGKIPKKYIKKIMKTSIIIKVFLNIIIINRSSEISIIFI
jgi:hypothetical protein